MVIATAIFVIDRAKAHMEHTPRNR